jgi:hypothetical protein
MGGQRVLAGRTKCRGSDRFFNEDGRCRVHGESVGPQSGWMVIAWDRRSGVSGRVPRYSHPTPETAWPEPITAETVRAGF